MNHPILRRWDHKIAQDNAAIEGALKLVANAGEDEKNWIKLEDGIQIQFPPTNGNYRAGDYWLIPARNAVDDVIWPRSKAADGTMIARALPPHGVEHHYAPLAAIDLDSIGTLAVNRSFRRIIAQDTIAASS
jgi:hypothetical protein